MCRITNYDIYRILKLYNKRNYSKTGKEPLEIKNGGIKTLPIKQEENKE